MRSRDGTSAARSGETRSPHFFGEWRTTSGRFSGVDDRLVHVSPHGTVRDYGYPLSGLVGIRHARFGLLPDASDHVHWFDGSLGDQAYVNDTFLVETVHETPAGTVRQFDLTDGNAHLTRFEHEDPPADAAIVAEMTFAPDGRDSQAGQLKFRDAAAVFHAEEHDYVASETGMEHRGPRTSPDTSHRREADSLTGRVSVAAPLEDGGTSFVSLLTDVRQIDRFTAGDRLQDFLTHARSRCTLVRRAEEQRSPSIPQDLGVLRLLSASNGLRMAGPEFDPEFRGSGGYGYTWFRDDAEIATYLLDLEEARGIDLTDWHRRSARMYCRTQLADGSWPHRVWPRDGTLAPGWANGPIEADTLLADGTDGLTDESLRDYQADQTASTVRFLATLRPQLGGDELAGAVDETLDRGIASLDATLSEDGRPSACQNAWEDDAGRFTHTVATFLGAYAAAGRLDPNALDGFEIRSSDSPAIGDPALERADRVYRAIDDLWVADGGYYARGEHPDGGLDDRGDSSTFALVDAHRVYDRVGDVDGDRIDRLVQHVDRVIDRLYRDPDDSAVAGLIRYEGDEWRRGNQAHEKIWTVATIWGANAAAELSILLRNRDDGRAEPFAKRADELMGLVAPTGPLSEESGFLAEQYFDDGRSDSATPLGWSHGLRAATRARMQAHGLPDLKLTTAED